MRGVVLRNRSRRAVLAVRTGLAAFVLAGTLVVSVGVEATPSSAGNSAFCSDIFSYVTAEAKITSDLASGSYAAYAQASLPYFEKIDSAAPKGKDKLVFNAVVKIFKYMASDKNLADLTKYLKLNQPKLKAATTTVANSIKSCA
jgi:hypothetical protein